MDKLIQLAQIPDKVIEKGADRLFDQGVLGVVLVLFIVVASVAVWKLIDCHKTHAAVATAQATAIATDAAAKIKVAEALEAVERRLDLVERRLDLVERRMDRLELKLGMEKPV